MIAPTGSKVFRKKTILFGEKNENKNIKTFKIDPLMLKISFQLCVVSKSKFDQYFCSKMCLQTQKSLSDEYAHRFVLRKKYNKNTL